MLRYRVLQIYCSKRTGFRRKMRTLWVKIIENQGLTKFLCQGMTKFNKKKLEFIIFINLLIKFSKGVNFDMVLARYFAGRKNENAAYLQSGIKTVWQGIEWTGKRGCKLYVCIITVLSAATQLHISRNGNRNCRLGNRSWS